MKFGALYILFVYFALNSSIPALAESAPALIELIDKDALATAIKETKQTVAASQPRAMRGPDSALIDLGTLSGSAFEYTTPIASNHAGQVVGQSGIGSRTEEALTGHPRAQHAFLWQNGTITDLDTVKDRNSFALGINEAGQIVGWTEPKFSVRRAFFWQAGRMVDLNDLLSADSGWVLLAASAINERGQIFGAGQFNGEAAAYRLTLPATFPAPAPPLPATPPVAPTVSTAASESIVGISLTGPVGTRDLVCSGIILDSTGIVVTDPECLNSASAIILTLKSGTSFPARLIARDDRTKVAVLKIDSTENLHAATLADSDHLEAGERLFTVAEFFRVGRRSVEGILQEPDSYHRSYNSPLIATSAYRTFGVTSRGTAWFDTSGKAVGMIVTSNGGPPLVVKANRLRQEAERLLKQPAVSPADEDGYSAPEDGDYETRHPNWLGLRMSPARQEFQRNAPFSDATGELVDFVSPGSPAAWLGLKLNDYIEAIRHDERGKTREIVYWRQGNPFRVKVPVDNRPEAMADGVSIGTNGGYGLKVVADSTAMRAKYQVGNPCCDPILIVTEVDPAGLFPNVKPGTAIFPSYDKKSPQSDAAKAALATEAGLKQAVDRALDGSGPRIFLSLSTGGYHIVAPGSIASVTSSLR